jgi:hypothetical protein
MARTRTLLVDIRKLERQGADGATVLCLMMALNDFATANQALGAIREDTSERTDYIRRGAGMYFVRVQMAHLYEAIELISAIDASPTLRQLVDACPGDAAEKFSELLNFAQGASPKEHVRKYLQLVRNKIAFHYDRDKVLTALSDRAARRGDAAHLMTISDDFRRVRFQVADDLVNTLVCHHIFDIDPADDVEGEVERILDIGFTIWKTFADFAGLFVTKYIQERATFTR